LDKQRLVKLIEKEDKHWEHSILGHMLSMQLHEES